MATDSSIECMSPFADYGQLEDVHVNSLSGFLGLEVPTPSPSTRPAPCTSWHQIASHWDAKVLTTTLGAIVFLLVSAFTVPACFDASSYPLGMHLECIAPSPDLDVVPSKRQSYFDMVSIILIIGNAAIVLVVSLYLGLQCTWSHKKIAANPHHANLTHGFVLPCYALVWYTFVGLSSCFFVGVFISIPTELWMYPGFDSLYCFLFHFPIAWIRQLLPVLMIQKSISLAAIVRSVVISGLMSLVFLSFIFIDKASDGIPIFFLGFHFTELLFYAWTKYICFARASFNAVYILLALTSLLYMMPPVVMLTDQHELHPSIYSRVTVVGNVVDAFTILAILLSLRADTKYWLGTDDNSVETTDPAKLYLRLIADRGMVSSFSTRTSVYDVHYMIEEFKQIMIDFSCLRLDAVVAQGATAVVLRGTIQKTLRKSET
ncbi:protein kinase, partial [Achlya hypogyna]